MLYHNKLWRITPFDIMGERLITLAEITFACVTCNPYFPWVLVWRCNIGWVIEAHGIFEFCTPFKYSYISNKRGPLNKRSLWYIFLELLSVTSSINAVQFCKSQFNHRFIFIIHGLGNFSLSEDKYISNLSRKLCYN